MWEYSVEQAKASHVYSYRHGFRGFAAKLTEGQADEVSSKPQNPIPSSFFSFFFKLLHSSISSMIQI